MSKLGFTDVVLLSSVSLLTSACGLPSRTPASPQWLADGSIALYREVKSPEPVAFTPGSLRAFAPINLAGARSGAPSSARIRLSLDTAAGTLTVRGLDTAPLRIPVEGADRLSASSSLAVVLKQESPLWYAPDSYFRQRGLRVPAAFVQERLRRGALGPYALFLSDGIPLHTAPLWSTEVGGLRVSEEVGAALFSLIPLGTTIEQATPPA